jgi:hypothetical protein
MEGPGEATGRRQAAATFAPSPLAAGGAKGVGRSRVLRSKWGVAPPLET